MNHRPVTSRVELEYPQICNEIMVIAEAHYFSIARSKVRQRFVQSLVGVYKFQLHRKLHISTTKFRQLSYHTES